MTFSRNQMLEAQLVDLNVSVPEVANMLQRLAGDHVPVRMTMPGTATRVRIEPGQLEQVMLNWS